ncbi:MAG: beta-lactamase family protein, partial [Leptospiraceae bacterium]|nr:beta-lactamase family protein [Leptospiraceae bacterium]
MFLGFVPPAWSQPDSGQPLPLKDNTERQLKEGQSAPQSSDNNANESRESTENNATNNAEGRGNANDTGSILDQNSQNDANDPGARFLPAAAEFRNYITPRLQRAMVDRHIPGAVLVVIHDGELYYLEGAGFSDLAARRSVDVNRTSFRVGRISALFTSALVLHARDQRLWDLPDAARQYSGTVQVPGHARRRNAAGQAAALSIRDLLYRETGLNALTTAPLVPTPADRRSLAYYLSREQPLPETGEIDVIRPSDYEITLLGHLLEQRSGMPFPEYARTRLFHPQSMRYSEFLPEELPA